MTDVTPLTDSAPAPASDKLDLGTTTASGKLGGFTLQLPMTPSVKEVQWPPAEPPKPRPMSRVSRVSRASRADHAGDCSSTPAFEITVPAAKPAAAGAALWGRALGKVKNTVECHECGASVWSAARYCPSCGASTQRDRKSTVEDITTRQRTMTRDTYVTNRDTSTRSEDEDDPSEYRSDICCFCAKRILTTEDFCPLDDNRELDGPKVHPACWDAFFADLDTKRCEWCYQEVVGDRGGVHDGFAPAKGRGLDTAKMSDNKYGAHGYWGRAHAMGANVPQGGAGGPVLGANRRVLHQWCVDEYSKNKGSGCLHCGKPVQLGYDVEGVGKVHKGFCYQQLQAQLEAERLEALAQIAKAEQLEFTCATCNQLIDPDSEYIELPCDECDDGDGADGTATRRSGAQATRKIHLACWSIAQNCVHCKTKIEEDDEYYDVDGGLCKSGCYAAWRVAFAPKCVHCGESVTGKHYPLAEGPCHVECYEPWITAHPPPEPETTYGTAGAMVRRSDEEDGRESATGGETPSARPYRATLRGVSTYGSRLTRMTYGTSTKSEGPSYDLGWMWKRGRLIPSWKRRWAMIRSGCLCYFSDADGLLMKGSIKLAGCHVRMVEITAKEAPRTLGAQMGFEIEHSGQTLLGFPAEHLPATSEDVAPWVLSVNEAIEEADVIASVPEKAAVLAKEQQELARKSQVDGLRWLLMASDGFRWPPMASDGFRWLPMASDGF